MPASIGVNLRVTGHCRQGGRKYMEDFFSVAYQQTEDERDLEYAFFGIYDGHGGAEAAAFAKERLMETIVRHKNFWSDNDEDVLRAIKLGYIDTHYAMWKEQDKWPKTASGLPSTAGTTASIAFIRRGKIYIGHVGDSGIVLGYQEPGSLEWKAKPLTRDHKPECALEMSRIEQCGGKVVAKSGVPRVVWNRPRIGHKGPVRRSTPIDEIPFLAVARSLGDLWSYNSELDEFVVSPDPDCSVIPIDTSTFRCLIFGTDGLYNMLNSQMAVHIVQQAERHNEDAALSDSPNKVWLNPSKCLVERALELWSTTKIRADNTSVVTLMLDPPGPPRAQVLRNRKKNYTDSGLQIMTRYQNETPTTEAVVTPEQPVTRPKTDEAEKMFLLKPRESLAFDPKSPVATNYRSPEEVSASTDSKALRFTSSYERLDSGSQVCRSYESTRSHSLKVTESRGPRRSMFRFSETKITSRKCDSRNPPSDGDVLGRREDAEMRSFNCRNSDFESFASTSYLSMRDCSFRSCGDADVESCDLDFSDEPSFGRCGGGDQGRSKCDESDKSSRRHDEGVSTSKYEENIQIHEISSSSNDADDTERSIVVVEPRTLRSGSGKKPPMSVKRPSERHDGAGEVKRRRLHGSELANGHDLRNRRTVTQQLTAMRLRLRKSSSTFKIAPLSKVRKSQRKKHAVRKPAVDKKKTTTIGIRLKDKIKEKLVQKKIKKPKGGVAIEKQAAAAAKVSNTKDKRDRRDDSLRRGAAVLRRRAADVPKLVASGIHNIKTTSGVAVCLQKSPGKQSNCRKLDKEYAIACRKSVRLNGPSLEMTPSKPSKACMSKKASYLHKLRRRIVCRKQSK